MIYYFRVKKILFKMSECCDKCKQNEKNTILLMKKLAEMEERISFLEKKK